MSDARDESSAGHTLRLLRVQAGLKQRQVARLAKVSPTYLSLVEAGHKTPTREWVGHVAAVIGEHLKVGA